MSGAEGTRRTGRGARRALAAMALVSVATTGLTAAGTPVALAEPTPGCVVDVTDIIGWWRGEDDLVAQVGPGLAGSALFTDAVVRRGFDFDGASAASTVATDPLPVVTDGVTVEAWVKPVVNGLVQTIVSRWDEMGGADTTRSYTLTIGPTGELTWATDEISTLRPDQLVIPSPAIYDGSYHHIAATWDLAQFTVYIDGVAVATKPSQGLPLNPATSTPFRLAATTAPVGDPLFFTGALDEAAVWRRAITPAEVSAIVSAGAAGKCTFVPTQRSKLLPPAGTGNGWLGFSVGTDGSSAIAGAPLQNGVTVFSGAAYVYTRGPSGWTAQQRLVPNDAALSDQFGWSVAMDGDTAVVGSYGNNGGGVDSGAAYVFTRTAGVWTQQAKLLSNDIAPQDGFGYSVAIDDDTIVVGAPNEDDLGSDSGAAYVFTRTAGVWTQQGKLVASNAATGDNYGSAVGIHLDTVVAGAPGFNGVGFNSGAAYVSTRTGSAWSEQAVLVPAGVADNDQFGRSVDVHGDTVVAGSPGDDAADVDTGSATVFARSGTTWSEQALLTAADAQVGDLFGGSVAIEFSTVVVGASLDTGASGTQTGSAYVFDRSGTAWSQLTKLEAADAAFGDRFGVAVSVGSSIVVGAYLDDDSGGNSGSAYVFSP